MLPIESKSVRYQALKSFAEIARLNTDHSLNQRIELGKVFRRNPVFDVPSRLNLVRLLIGKMRILYRKLGHIPSEARVLRVPVPRYLGCIVSIRNRVEDRLERQTRRELAHS